MGNYDIEYSVDNHGMFERLAELYKYLESRIRLWRFCFLRSEYLQVILDTRNLFLVFFLFIGFYTLFFLCILASSLIFLQVVYIIICKVKFFLDVQLLILHN